MALVAAEIVHDDNVAGLERRHEEMLDIAFGAFAVDRSIKDARRVDPVAPQGRNVLPNLTAAGRYSHPRSPNAERLTPDGAYHPPVR